MSTFDLRRSQIRAMMIDITGMCAAKTFIMPISCLTSALSLDVGIHSIASIFAGTGLIPLGVTIVPRYLT